MHVPWTQAASSDLDSIANYLFERTPEHAARLIRENYEAAANLNNYPNRGRLGKREGTPELAIRDRAYLIVYKTSIDALFIVRILHGAQHWQCRLELDRAFESHNRLGVIIPPVIHWAFRH